MLDNSRRFNLKKSFKICDKSQRSYVWENKILIRGIWIIINHSGSFYTGMIVNFQILMIKLKSKRLYPQDELNL